MRKSVRIGPKTDTFSALPGKSPSGFKRFWQNLYKNQQKKAASLRDSLLNSIRKILLQDLCERVAECLEECVLGCCLVHDAAYAGAADGDAAN